MKAIYLDCFAGISGNMLLGAFLQAGVPEGYLREQLSKLPIAHEFALHVEEVKKNGIAAFYVDVELLGPDAPHPAVFAAVTKATSQAETHVHMHEGHKGEHGHTHAHVHRTMADIRVMLEKSALGAEVKKQALQIFNVIAEAEGKVHGMPADEVHFHEVGAVDSIVDIVGTAICLDYLEIEKVFVSRLNTGSGFVKCAHGVMMVPAPATAELLKGLPVYHAGAEKELTTPTGAAVVKALAEYQENLPAAFLTERIAYGAGTWDLDIPNVLRMYLGSYKGAAESQRYLLEMNIDDMNPQIFGYVSELLFQAGALDVWTTPICMKKNRPAQTLSVMTDTIHKEECIDIIFRETSSIGLRVVPIEQRIEAVRHTAKVNTKYGEIHCKVSAYKGQIVSISAEYEDCRRLALEKHVPLKEVQQEALSELRGRL